MKQYIVTIRKMVRAAEWWEYKLVPLLGIGYATAFVSKTPLIEAVPTLLIAFVGLVIGAVFASLINDVTDIDDDLEAGKKNRMAKFSERSRWVCLAGCLTLGVAFGIIIYPDLLSLFFYAMAWLSFILYSVPPIRLKIRGGIGVVCCACGESLFPALFIVSEFIYYTGFSAHFWWFITVGIWAFASGLRAILWHQFVDRENDINTNTNTFATKVIPEKFRPVTTILFGVELIAAIGMLLQIQLFVIWIGLLLYVVLVMIRYKRYTSIPIVLLTPANAQWQVLMMDFYQAFLPLSLLVAASLSQPWAWMILLAHAILFPKTIFIAARDYWRAVFYLYRKVVRYA
ncbi:UbiA family prenyltransferase [Parapedobacter sp. 10938]|uniref:UbiA family prenyltransferase n=1 Tax=Parapedobacter flavus TaxID=3110225 RepID=UPI002DBE19C8|nr:UbiA family prenyltransferase [Parapedobacter sp. 10938]MEC3879907.1 UbiA family prenyltransferase [Parapedobacter sp. 10938]